ncbi:family 16 glycosylhydrolase [Thalassobellus suaedae]|uniref:Family 16 glycosylhydrolase n=1 Tax=Thalassobellus suaedae TaxID=3074124 RepID=A0ABY9Y3D4_9FLAO|nr:family 16 glycosylhydrolase [Flavobacteriaceae bacterium HL-DH10]
MTFSKTDNFVKLDVAKLNPIKTLISFVENDSIKPIVYLDSTSFDTQENFEAHWNMFYPWGTDHNGSARMHKENIILEENGILKIKAEYTNQVSEGKSSSDPHLPITFHSGAVHFNKQIRVTKDLSCWTISGDFKAPTVNGSWPAFWITGASNWPPEIDILEFKGTTKTLQNTVTGRDWNHTEWTTVRTDIPDAATQWHNYKLHLIRLDDVNLLVKMYIDGQLKSNEIKDFTNKPFWLIINMQMEGASGKTNNNSIVRTTPQYFQAKNIYVAAKPNK